MGFRRQPEDYEEVAPSRPRSRRAADSEPELTWQTSQRRVEAEDADDAHASEPPFPDNAIAPANSVAGVSPQPLVWRGHTITYLGLFLFSLVLLTRPSDWYPGVLTNSLAFYLAVLTLGMFVVGQLMEGRLSVRPREVYCVLALLVAGFLSIFFANQSRAFAYETFAETFVRAIIMFVVLVNVVRTERRLRWLLLLSLGVGVYLAGSALNDYLSGNMEFEGYRVGGALQGMFGNPNDLSQYLAAMLPVAVALLCLSRGIVRRIGYALCSLLLVAGIVVTFSRGGALAMTAVFFVLTWKLGKRHRVFFMALALVGWLVFFAAAPGSYRTRLLSIFDSNLEVAEGSANARRGLLKESVKVALRHPLFGIGMGNFRLIYERVTHNAYTQVASEMGLFGFCAYLLFIVTPLKRLREIERATDGDPPQRNYYFLAIGLQAVLVGYMVSSFFGAVAYYFNVYYFVGYAVSLRMIYYQSIGLPVDAKSLPLAATDEKTRRRESSAQERGLSVATELSGELSAEIK